MIDYHFFHRKSKLFKNCSKSKKIDTQIVFGHRLTRIHGEIDMSLCIDQKKVCFYLLDQKWAFFLRWTYLLAFSA